MSGQATNWDAALRELEDKVADVERRLEEGAWEDLDDVPFAPPDVEVAMTPAQHETAAALLQRVLDAKRRLQDGIDETRSEVEDLERRRTGARRYAQSDYARP